MDKKAMTSLKRSFVGIVFICLAVFFIMAIFLSRRVENTVTHISEFYMSNMSNQLQQKFSLVIELTSEKMDGTINRTPPESAVYGEKMLKELQTSAMVRNFIYLGFLRPDGRLETIYGPDMEITDDEDIIDALKSRGRTAETGMGSDGRRCLLLGCAAQYPMSDGTKSVALVAGVSVEYLSSVIFAETDDTVIFSHIIDENGNYVIRTSLPGSTSANYFDYIQNEMEGIGPGEASRYVDELKAAIHNRDGYGSAVTMEGEVRRVFCMPLVENSTWYLITVMPSGFLDDSITQLDHERMVLMMGAFFVVLMTLAFLFLQYSRLSKRQLELLEAAREEASRANKSKSDFLSSMSHDIRTPMNAIVGMSEIALKNLDDKDRVEDCLKKVKVSSGQLLGLINDILDLSKIESGKMAFHIDVVSIRQIMDGMVNIIQPQIKSKDQHFDIFIQDILCENVWSDNVRLNQILLNVLSNALKYTPNGGKIEVHLNQEPSPQGEEYVRTHFRVTDNGIGMTPEFQLRIFESFERDASNQVRHIEGSGLGMSITKRIIDMMGGTIEVESELGKGSTFYITVDLKRAKPESEMRLPEWNILVVDDNEQLCMSAAANLEDLGVHAEWIQDGLVAARMIEERHNRQEDYQFVLVDWKMPYTNGLQTIKEIHRRVGDAIPIFLISAYDWSDIQDEMDAVEIEGFISKPLFKSTLYDRLSQYIEDQDALSRQDVEEKVDFTGKHVLLAEDNDINWEIAHELLGETGMELDRAENGKVCVDKFRQSEVGYYDGILMDIHMPEMDGYEATRLIRAEVRSDRDIPIIAMTADAFSEDVQHCMECGMNHHLAKPLNFQECNNVLKRFLL